MKRFYASLLVVAIAIIALQGSAKASGGVADPGFSYVDVNNDGLYNPADGDIGLLSYPPVDIDLLIETYGYFDTSRNEGNYIAPRCPASLVITGSTPHAAATSLTLKAGVNLTVHALLSPAAASGTLSAPTITLEACRTIDLTDTDSEFVTQMCVQGGCKVILDGAVVTGSDPASTLNVSSGGDISARKTGNGTTTPVQVTSILTGDLVSLCADGCITMDGSAITAYESNAELSLTAGGELNAFDQTSLYSGGDTLAESDCSAVCLSSDYITSGTLRVCAACDANVTSANVIASGAFTIQAGGCVTGNSSSTNFVCGSLDVNACQGSDLSSSVITATTGGIDVDTREDIFADSVQWYANTAIELSSSCGDIYARSAHMEVNLLGPITFYAGGGCINVTGSVFVGTVQYGPRGVNVVGP